MGTPLSLFSRSYKAVKYLKLLICQSSDISIYSASKKCANETQQIDVVMSPQTQKSALTHSRLSCLKVSWVFS